MDFHLRLDGSISPPSWLVCITACLSLFLMPSLYRCFIITSVQSQSFFSFCFLFLFFFFFSPKWAFSEGGLFVLQPGSQLFSGSAVFFSLCSVWIPQGNLALSDIFFFFVPLTSLFVCFFSLLIILQFARILSLTLMGNSCKVLRSEFFL